MFLQTRIQTLRSNQQTQKTNLKISDRHNTARQREQLHTKTTTDIFMKTPVCVCVCTRTCDAVNDGGDQSLPAGSTQGFSRLGVRQETIGEHLLMS